MYFVWFVVIVLAVFLLGKWLSRRRQLPGNAWKLVDSVQEEIPKRPSEMPKEKNGAGIYLDRLSFIENTGTEKYWDASTESWGLRIAHVASLASGFLPLYTTVHNNEEHYLTTIYLSFHFVDKQYFLDIASLDTAFKLDANRQISFLFTDGHTENFSFERSLNDESADHFSFIPLHEAQIRLFAEVKLDKWCLISKQDHLCAVGSLNFEIRKYIYKPELQYTIQLMAQKILLAQNKD